MLVLTRKENEAIRIGDDIEIVVRRVAGNRVTIAVAAPRDIRILRGELQQFDDAPVREPGRDRTPRPGTNPSREPIAIVQGRIPRSAIGSTCDALVG